MIPKKEENGEKYVTATTEAEFHEALNRGLAVELTRELAEKIGAGCPGSSGRHCCRAVYRLPVEKFSGATRSPGFQGFCQGATPCLICSMRSSLTLRA